MNDTDIHVVFLCDNLTFFQAFVAAQSVADTASGARDVFVHVAMAHPSQRQKDAVAGLARPGVLAECHDLSSVFPSSKEKCAEDVEDGNLVFWKIRLPLVFPELNRILFLGNDVLVRKSLDDLFDVDLRGRPIGAVKDPTAGHLFRRKGPMDICMKAHADYFDTGVLLMDLKAMRESGAVEKLLVAEELSKDGPRPGQTSFNLVFAHRALLLPPRWNLMVSFLKASEKKWTPDRFHSFFGTACGSFRDMAADAAVWRFVPPWTPWDARGVYGAGEWKDACRAALGRYRDPLPIRWRKASMAARRRMDAWRAFIGGKADALVHGFALRREERLYALLEKRIEARFAKERARGPLALNKEKAACEISLSSQPGVAGPGQGKGVVVSITSYPGRIYDLQYTLHSLLSQTFRPERVVLWLGAEKFPRREQDVPAPVLDLRKRGLEIRFTHDAGPFTKLLPALREFPDNPIVTADDDIYYPPDWLQGLVLAWLSSPSSIWAARVRAIRRGPDGVPTPFGSKANQTNREDPSFLLLPEGVAGILYPPRSLDPRVFQEETFQCVTPKNDDFWFWAMAVLHGTKIGGTGSGPERNMCVNPAREAGLNGDATLWSQNGRGGGNGMQFAALLSEYPELLGLLESSGL